MDSISEFAPMAPPPIMRFTADTTNSDMINDTHSVHISPIQLGEATQIPQGGVDAFVPTPPMSYTPSSSELSSISSMSAQDGFSSTTITASGTPGLQASGHSYTPANPTHLPLKNSNPVKGWRNIAPAPAPPTIAAKPINPTFAYTATTALATTPNVKGVAIAPASTPKASPSKPAPRRRKTGGSSAKSRNPKKSSRHGDDDEGVIKAEFSDSDEDSSDAQITTTQTKSGRQIHRPTLFTPEQIQTKSTSPDSSQQQPPRKRRRVYRRGKEVNVICLRCDRGHSPRCNAIVFCDDCNAPWHQFCHDPPIGDEVITVKEKEWFCSECRPTNTTPIGLNLPVNGVVNGTNNIQKSISSPAATASSTSTSATHTLAMLGGSHFSPAEKSSYFSSLSHAALVNLLVNISDSRPDIPLFPANMNELQTSSFGSDTSKTGQSIGGATVAPIRNQPSGNVPANASRGGSNENGGDSDEEEMEDHRLYPRPGNGFRLPPDSEDLDILLEDPSSTTFSHALHGSAKATAEANQMRVVDGIA